MLTVALLLVQACPRARLVASYQTLSLPGDLGIWLLPYVGVLRKKILLVGFLLPSDGIVIFFRRIVRLLFQVR